MPFFITPEPAATLEHFVAHVDRAVEIMGVERVGIGTDWGAAFPKPLEALLDAEMLRFGFRPEHRTSWGGACRRLRVVARLAEYYTGAGLARLFG